jgi:ribose/xylose/arabinose/galactoside ABC-type transport system permease subunit
LLKKAPGLTGRFQNEGVVYMANAQNIGLLAKVRSKIMGLSIFVFYIVFVIVMSFLSPYFFTPQNLLNILQYSAILGVLSVGMTIVIISGGIDISLGSMLIIIGIVIAKIIPPTGSVLLMSLVGVLLGTFCGFINGLISTKLRVVPFIATLATMQIIQGIALLLAKGSNIPFNNQSFALLGRGYVFGFFPISCIILIVVSILGILLLKFLPYGRKLLSVGANSTASSLVGINPDNVRLVAYIICGFCAGIAGIINTSQNSAGMVATGTNAGMNAIAASVLGGTNMAGGKGSIIGTLMGVIIINSITNGLNLMGISSYWQQVVQGAILVLVVSLNVLSGD